MFLAPSSPSMAPRSRAAGTPEGTPPGRAHARRNAIRDVCGASGPCETRPVTTYFFVVATIGFLLAANATRPIPIPPLGAVPRLFPGWPTARLSPHHLAA